jgi:hypothetical protein
VGANLVRNSVVHGPVGLIADPPASPGKYEQELTAAVKTGAAAG